MAISESERRLQIENNTLKATNERLLIALKGLYRQPAKIKDYQLAAEILAELEPLKNSNKSEEYGHTTGREG